MYTVHSTCIQYTVHVYSMQNIYIQYTVHVFSIQYMYTVYRACIQYAVHVYSITLGLQYWDCFSTCIENLQVRVEILLGRGKTCWRVGKPAGRVEIIPVYGKICWGVVNHSWGRRKTCWGMGQPGWGEGNLAGNTRTETYRDVGLRDCWFICLLVHLIVHEMKYIYAWRWQPLLKRFSVIIALCNLYKILHKKDFDK